MTARHLAEIEKVSSTTPVPGTALRIVAERRPVAPLNLFHLAASDGEILVTVENRGELIHLIHHAKAAADEIQEQGR